MRKISPKELKNLLNFKKRMEEANINTANILYCDEIPMLGVDRSYVIEEIYGIKVAKLISNQEE